MCYKYNFKHYFNYLKQNYILSNKRLFEYKVNVINVLFVHIFQIFVMVLFTYVFIENYGDVINWTFSDGLFFLLSMNLSYYLIAHSFFAFKDLNIAITKGDLNLILFKPGNIFLNFILKVEFTTIFFILNILTFIGILIYLENFNFFNFLISLPLMFLVSFSFLSTFFFIDSFSFYFLKGADSFRDFYRYEISQRMFGYFPMQLFKNSNLLFLLSFFPLFYLSMLIVPVLKDGIIENILTQIIILIIISLIFIILTLINWKIGLKKYSAFS